LGHVLMEPDARPCEDNVPVIAPKSLGPLGASITQSYLSY
jgi:hypothetical protein